MLEGMTRIVRRFEGATGRCLICEAPARWSARPQDAPEEAAARLCDGHARRITREREVFWSVAAAARWTVEAEPPGPPGPEVRARDLRVAFLDARTRASRVPEAVRRQLELPPD
jgi:hypothetical protein